MNEMPVIAASISSVRLIWPDFVCELSHEQAHELAAALMMASVDSDVDELSLVDPEELN